MQRLQGSLVTDWIARWLSKTQFNCLWFHHFILMSSSRIDDETHLDATDARELHPSGDSKPACQKRRGCSWRRGFGCGGFGRPCLRGFGWRRHWRALLVNKGSDDGSCTVKPLTDDEKQELKDNLFRYVLSSRRGGPGKFFGRLCALRRSNFHDIGHPHGFGRFGGSTRDFVGPYACFSPWGGFRHHVGFRAPHFPYRPCGGFGGHFPGSGGSLSTPWAMHGSLRSRSARPCPFGYAYRFAPQCQGGTPLWGFQAPYAYPAFAAGYEWGNPHFGFPFGRSYFKHCGGNRRCDGKKGTAMKPEAAPLE